MQDASPKEEGKIERHAYIKFCRRCGNLFHPYSRGNKLCETCKREIEEERCLKAQRTRERKKQKK